ncbi:FIG146085: 3'-to-5' oligoribonuclease A, Bacillus type [hydrothermal vent metagenome]|uniref:FIG146085: 3'-to-5' oligoribonuclease A, Bacillus type n=1 Tax=hydrothermal vent metagenome TaxID=652676 RepID=A0A1W1BY94_9ZZZZ
MLRDLIPNEQIDTARHILIKSDKETLAQASVLYSYLLTLHKKVSWYAESIDMKFAFLPWFEKLRMKNLSSADVVIDADVEMMDLYDFLQKKSVKINPKIATALYAGFLKRYKNFISEDIDGTVFAILSQLVTSGADHRLCVSHLSKNTPLCMIRLKATLFERCLLKENATVASVSIDESDLLKSGVSMEEVIEAAAELLNIVHVEKVQLIKSDEDNKIIIIKDS